MTDEERQQAIAEHVAACREDRAMAVETLDMIKQGVRFYRGVPGADPTDVTENHRQAQLRIVGNMDRILQAYGASNV